MTGNPFGILRQDIQEHPLTYALAGILVAVFLIQSLLRFMGGPDLRLWFALTFADGEPWRYITHVFVHRDVAHAGVNLAMLLVFGRVSEHVNGGVRTLTVFMFGEIIALYLLVFSIKYGVVTAGPGLGASAAILVVAGYAAVTGSHHSTVFPSNTEEIREKIRAAKQQDAEFSWGALKQVGVLTAQGLNMGYVAPFLFGWAAIAFFLHYPPDVGPAMHLYGLVTGTGIGLVTAAGQRIGVGREQGTRIFKGITVE